MGFEISSSQPTHRSERELPACLIDQPQVSSNRKHMSKIGAAASCQWTGIVQRRAAFALRQTTRGSCPSPNSTFLHALRAT